MMGWGGWKEKERNLRFREYENDMVWCHIGVILVKYLLTFLTLRNPILPTK
jgi:hypothetical protein